jgi:hypothetical protein
MRRMIQDVQEPTKGVEENVVDQAINLGAHTKQFVDDDAQEKERDKHRPERIVHEPGDDPRGQDRQGHIDHRNV